MSTTETANQNLFNLELFNLVDFEFEVPCDSEDYYHREDYPDAHAADWIVLVSCGHAKNWCNPRLTQYIQSRIYGEEMDCAQCGAEDVTVIRTAPIRG